MKLAITGKGGVGKTSISAAFVRLLTEVYPDSRILAIDADPAALARRLCREAAGKHWLAHPKADTYLAGRIALLQRLYKR